MVNSVKAAAHPQRIYAVLAKLGMVASVYPSFATRSYSQCCKCLEPLEYTLGQGGQLVETQAPASVPGSREGLALSGDFGE